MQLDLTLVGNLLGCFGFFSEFERCFLFAF